MRLTVTRQTALNLTVKKGHFFTVNHQTQVKINRKKQSTLDNSNHQGKSKTVRVIGSSKRHSQK